MTGLEFEEHIDPKTGKKSVALKNDPRTMSVKGVPGWDKEDTPLRRIREMLEADPSLVFVPVSRELMGLDSLIQNVDIKLRQTGRHLADIEVRPRPPATYASPSTTSDLIDVRLAISPQFVEGVSDEVLIHGLGSQALKQIKSVIENE